MPGNKFNISLVLSAVLVILFGLFLFQLRWVAMVCLCLFLATFIISVRSHSFGDTCALFGFKPARWHWIVLAIVGGASLSMFYRWYQSDTLVPYDINSFALIAIMIGITEELIFRGYFLGWLMKYQRPVWFLATSALLHAAYKSAIFLPFEAIHLTTLFGWTFLTGILLAYFRWKSLSIWPSMSFHALFDLWVYGDRVDPWWIW